MFQIGDQLLRVLGTCLIDFLIVFCCTAFVRSSQLLDAESFAGVGDHTRVGSPLFMAPEILLREEYGPQVVSGVHTRNIERCKLLPG